jgi:predicted RNA binding protein YcfA (HicA-like mRNA interferase family)
MTPLPGLRPREVIAILRRLGYEVDHQTGSHAILYKPDHLPITVPMHHRDLKTGTLRQIIRNTGLSVEEFLRHR